MPQARSGKGKFIPDVEVAERRYDSATMRSKGATWQAIANKHWNGDTGTAARAVKQFWAERPQETVEEIRAAMLAKLDGLEEEVRRVMARRHYVVAEGRIVQNHNPTTCARLEANGYLSTCSCPKLLDDQPIYQGVDRVRQLVETQLKLIPGLAAPKRMEVMTDDLIADEIQRARDELAAERLAAARLVDGATAGDAAGAAESAEGSG